MRMFFLERRADVTGVSGTGRVAAGVVFDDGVVALRWYGAHAATTIYPTLADVRAIHGHDGATKVVFVGVAVRRGRR